MGHPALGMGQYQPTKTGVGEQPTAISLPTFAQVIIHIPKNDPNRAGSPKTDPMPSLASRQLALAHPKTQVAVHAIRPGGVMGCFPSRNEETCLHAYAWGYPQSATLLK